MVARALGVVGYVCNPPTIFVQSRVYNLNGDRVILRFESGRLALIRQSSTIVPQSLPHDIGEVALILQCDAVYLSSLPQSSPIGSPIITSPRRR